MKLLCLIMISTMVGSILAGSFVPLKRIETKRQRMHDDGTWGQKGRRSRSISDGSKEGYEVERDYTDVS